MEGFQTVQVGLAKEKNMKLLLLKVLGVIYRHTHVSSIAREDVQSGEPSFQYQLT